MTESPLHLMHVFTLWEDARENTGKTLAPGSFMPGPSCYGATVLTLVKNVQVKISLGASLFLMHSTDLFSRQ